MVGEVEVMGVRLRVVVDHVDVILPEDHNNKREALIRLVERLREVVEEVYG